MIPAEGNQPCMGCNPVKIEDIGQTGTHELGHGAGLEHVSSDKNLMYYGGNGVEVKPEQMKKMSSQMPRDFAFTQRLAFP
jgi:hypothetical protein